MNEIEKRFGWRLRNVLELVKEKSYEEAFSEYSKLVRLFTRLDGYEDSEKLEFYKKIKFVGDDLLFKLFKIKISQKIKKHKFSSEEFKRKLEELTKTSLDEEICHLIKKGQFEKALKRHYENR